MPNEELYPVPSSPGVYVFRDGKEAVLYVGKSRNLKRRILDHLQIRAEKDALIVGQYAKVEFIPTRSEREALLLEANLVREYRPRYNVLLKDDRSFPYIQVTTGDRFPRVSIVRRPKSRKGVTLFGPYTGAREARNLVRFIEDTFHLRRCRKLPRKECLYFHMGLCPAPCTGRISEEEYAGLVKQSILVLQGRGKELVPSLEAEMVERAAKLDFERAAVLRDALAAIGNLRERQQVSRVGGDSLDLLAVHLPEWGGTSAVVGMLRVREGNVVRAEPHGVTIPEDVGVSRGEVLSDYLMQNYARRTDLPGLLYVPKMAQNEMEDLREAQDYLLEERGVETRVADSGRMRSLMELAERAAVTHASTRGIERDSRGVLAGLQELLSLPAIPRIIEGIDISILQGVEPVGSLVHFEDGEPDTGGYRRFRIKTVEGMDDFAMIREVVRRRIGRLRDEGKPLPDLLLIDGGASQVAKAVEALEELGLAGKVPLVGLAKKNEELYLPGVRDPVRPDRNSPSMLLLRGVRDEAHRFAVGYHRKRRQMVMREEFKKAR